MITINKIILCGRLIKDAELQVLKNIQGTNVLKYTIAVDRDYKDKSGEKITDFINVEQIGKDLSKLYPHLLRGRQVIVEGQLNIDKVNDKYFTKVKAQRVQFVGTTGVSKETENVKELPIDDDDTPF
ncbi:MAG: single-stranded DNA-binding protein [Clostridium sp.]|nr:single-stranded DNA-binding protein [Clostridium sp.]